jgi:hypothetical protein
MDEGVVGVVRRRRSRAEAAALLAEYEASGLSRVEFCARHCLAVGTLDRYRKQRQQLRGAAVEPGRWVAVEVSACSSAGVVDPSQADALGRASGLVVVLGPGRRIELERGFDAATLERLVPLLERV